MRFWLLRSAHVARGKFIWEGEEEVPFLMGERSRARHDTWPRAREQRRRVFSSLDSSILPLFLNLTGALWLNSPSSPRPRWVVGTDFSRISHESTPRWEESRYTKEYASSRNLYLKLTANWLRAIPYIYLLAPFRGIARQLGYCQMYSFTTQFQLNSIPFFANVYIYILQESDAVIRYVYVWLNYFYMTN